MKKTFIAVTTVMATFALAACDVDQTEEGEMPEVNVEGGNMPEYEVSAPDVDVRMEEKTVEVPVVDVDSADDAAGEPVTGDE